VLAALAVLACGPPAANAARPGGATTVGYTAEILGYLPGNNQSQAFGVSRRGNVVGQSAGGSGEQRAFYWDARTRTLSDITRLGANGGAFAIAGDATEYAVGYENASDGGHAALWISPPSQPIYLDGSGSGAMGVNDYGTAVGHYRGTAAIWSLSGGAYERTDIPLRDGDVQSSATDVNNDNIVVGYGYAQGTYAARGFLRLTDGRLVDIAPLAGHPESVAGAVSNVSNGVVRVTGSSGAITTGGGESRAVRWTVDVRTGAIVETLVLTQSWTGGVNDAGDVAGTTNKRGTQSASLWRNGTYLPLKAPNGSGSSAARAMVRTVGSPSYVAGVGMVNNWPMAVRWVIK
jgi:probable HAF family extracellular repeat protein